MGKYWRLIGHYNGEAQTYEALAGTFQTSPYTPDEDATLVGMRIIPGGEAATSLVEGVQLRLTCTTFKPNTLHVACVGNGLATAPAMKASALDYEVNQPVKAGVPITIEGRHAVATAVTANLLLMGCFQS
jgi:hypothetical protein